VTVPKDVYESGIDLCIYIGHESGCNLYFVFNWGREKSDVCDYSVLKTCQHSCSWDKEKRCVDCVLKTYTDRASRYALETERKELWRLCNIYLNVCQYVRI